MDTVDQFSLGRVIAAFVSSVIATGCAPTGMRPIPAAIVSPRVLQAADRGAVSADMMFDLVVGANVHNERRLSLLPVELAATNDVLSPQDFADRFGASAGDYHNFVTWLKTQGFEIVRTMPGRTAVSVRGNAAAIKAAFGVDMHSYEDEKGVFASASSAVSVANEVFNLVSGVAGIDGSYGWGSHIARPDRAAVPFAGTGSQTPADLQQRYGYGAITTPGMGQTVAILSTNSPTLASDVNAFLSGLEPDGPSGITQLAAGQYTQVFVGGPNRDPADPKAYGENTLDAQMVLAMAPYAKVVQVFTATNGAGLFADGIAYIVNQLPDVHAVTVSWGTCERGAGGEMPILNALFAQARAQGQQWFFASGDSGTDGCRDGSGNKIKSAGWPASSPSVVGVGGTSVVDANTEGAWSGAGGGPSETLDKPAYQMGANLTPADASRDEPDVAAMADPSPGVLFYDHGTQGAIGGTSVAAPLWAGIYAVLLQQKAPAGKGFTNALEQFYTLAKAGKGLTDITTGGNTGPGGGAGGYSAGAGYDMVTGWGTANLTSLIANWQ